MGGDGVVSVASNEIPGELVALCAAALAGDWETARRIHERWLPLFLGNFRGGPNPVPAKAALRLMGLLDIGHGPRAAPAARPGRAGRDGRHAPRGSGWSRRPAAGSRPTRPTRPARPSHDADAAPAGRRDGASTPSTAIDPATFLADLEAGRLRAAEPDPAAPDGWRVRPEVKAAILACFADRTTTDWTAGPLTFRDRAAVPPRDDLAGGPWRIVPGGTAVRRGAHLGDGVVVMPPSYVNVGAWVGAGTMVDSHVLVGSCAQIGARVHLAAGVTIGGVLEPPGARPVIVEDDAFVGAGSALLEGVLVGRGAVIGAGVTLTGTSRLYDLVRGPRPRRDAPTRRWSCPAGAVVVPGSRALHGQFAAQHGLSASVALLVKDRDAGTSARVALEEALR